MVKIIKSTDLKFPPPNQAFRVLKAKAYCIASRMQNFNKTSLKD